MLTRQHPLEGIGRTQAGMLKHLRRKGMASRVQLAEMCGITAAAVSMMTRDLIERGIILEGARRSGGRGAPHIDLMLSEKAGYAIGLHANRYAVSIVLLDFRGTLAGEWQERGSFETFSGLLAAVERLKGKLAAASAIDPRLLIGAGIAMPTRFHQQTASLDLAQEVIGWTGSDLAAALEEILGCPVMIENDANAAAMGELTMGNAATHENFVYLYLSEGIGSGLIVNGELYRGHAGNAGEVGALRARGRSRPSFDDLASWCLAHAGNIPEGRSAEEWTTYLEQHAAVLEAWLEKAGPETAKLAFMVAAILAPSAIYLGGTLPWMVRKRLAAWLEFATSDPFEGARVLQPQILVPQNSATDAVAFGAAAMILHELRG